MVNWEARAKPRKRLKLSTQMTVFKLEFDFFATFKDAVAIYNNGVDNRCFRCKRLNEDINHVIRCQSAVTSMNKLWREVVESALNGPGSCQYVSQSKIPTGHAAMVNTGTRAVGRTDSTSYG